MTDIKKKWQKEDDASTKGWKNLDSRGESTASNRRVPDYKFQGNNTPRFRPKPPPQTEDEKLGFELEAMQTVRDGYASEEHPDTWRKYGPAFLSLAEKGKIKQVETTKGHFLKKSVKTYIAI